MKITYFEKRPGAWHLNFRDQAGVRRRPYGGRTEAEAKRNAPEVVARTLAGEALSNGSESTTITQAKPVVTGWTFKRAFRIGMRDREKWRDAKDQPGLEAKYDALVSYWGKGRAGEDTDLGVVTTELAKEWLAHMRSSEGKRKGTKLTNSTINHRLSMLTVLQKIAGLPPHGVPHLSLQTSRRKRRARDLEVQSMIAWLLSKRHARNHLPLRGAASFVELIQVAQECGARQGELLALLWTDVYFDRKMLCFRDPKNGEMREVPMTDTVVTLLERRLKAGMKGPFKDLDKDRCTDLWASAREATGLGHDHEFVFHVATRHEALSRLGEDNNSAFMIQAVAGHKDIKTSAKYVKVSPEATRESLAKASRRRLVLVDFDSTTLADQEESQHKFPPEGPDVSPNPSPNVLQLPINNRC